MSSKEIWGVGQIRAGARALAFPVTHAELLRDSVWAGRQLARHEIQAGKFVLIASMSNEGAHVQPFDAAAAAAGHPLCQVDAVPYEAPRVLSVLKNLPVAIVLGMPASLLAALFEEGVSPALTFGDTPVLLRPEAARAWRERSARPVLHWYPLGPAVAFECPAASGPHVNGAEWDVRAGESGLRVTGLVDGRRQFAAVETGRPGRVLTARCACGSDDPRIVLE